MKQIELDFVIIVVGAVVAVVILITSSSNKLPELNAALKISARIFT